MAPPSKNGKILFIDAYDSFSENIAALLCQVLGVKVTMIHIDTRIEDLLDRPIGSVQDALAVFLHQFDAVVLGPGPGNPELASDVGLFPQIWNLSMPDILPVLGMCLGFQSLCVAYGGLIARLPEPCHGQAKKINHCGEDVFADAGEVVATNYNSLEVKLGDRPQLTGIAGSNSSSASLDSTNSLAMAASQTSLPNGQEFKPFQICPNLRPLAWDNSGTLMGVRHVELPYWGLQFHPESCRSNLACRNIIKNWWEASIRWLGSMKPTLTAPARLLSPGHVWSRPRTPIHGIIQPSYIQDDMSTPKLYNELQTLTVSSGRFVQTKAIKLPESKSRVAELCKTLSQNGECMLESTRKGRYSIYALPSPADWRIEYSLETSVCSIYHTDRIKSRWKMNHTLVLEDIHKLVAERMAKGGQERLPFWGGFVGFFSYELGLASLDISRTDEEASASIPDISLRWIERNIVIDHTMDKIHIQSIRREDSTWIEETTTKLTSLACPINSTATCSEELRTILASTEITLPDEETYKQRIKFCQSYLHSGDSYELCLTTEAQIRLPSQPENAWLLYRNLRHHNPVPFSAFLHLGKTTILSSSPEQFLTWDRCTGAIDMIPMKGTVAKSPSMTLSLAQEILACPKESAENLMIADLIRHDLYSTVGWNASVELVKLCEVVEHETVYQLVSHIRAIPPISSSLPDDDRQREIIRYGHRALLQTLPPGSMTGAPKKRSCEILDRLEQRRRGVYSGVLGYLDVGGGGGFSVCIRTAVSNADEDTEDGRQIWRVGAGGAITVLSDVDGEWREMRTKLESVLRAFRLEK